MKNESDGVQEALRKKALGYESEEVVEEWGVNDGELQLVKRKVTKKEVPPDLSALKTYMEISTPTDRYESMSVEELLQERDRLLSQLKNYDEGELYETNQD